MRMLQAKVKRQLTALALLPLLLGAWGALADHTSQLYSLADLQVLVQHEDWSELLAHVKDIPPRKRDDAWIALVEKAAIARLNDLVLRGDDVTAYQESEYWLAQAATLKRSRRYLDLRGKIAVRYHAQCLKQRGGASCVPAMRGSLNTDPQNRKLGLALARMTRQRFSSAAAVRFYRRILKSADPLCTDDDVKVAVFAALSLSPKTPEAQDARHVVTALCFPKYKTLLQEELYGLSMGSYSAENICPILKKRRLLSAFQSAFCEDVIAKGGQ